MAQQSPTKTCSVCHRPIEAPQYANLVEVREVRGKRAKETVTASMHMDCATRALPRGSNFLKLLRKQAGEKLAEDTSGQEEAVPA